MAKQPVEDKNRFNLHCEVASERMGAVLAALTIIGVERVGYELITDVKAYGSPKQKRYETTAVELAVAWLEKNPTFHVKDLANHFGELGRNKSTAHYAVRELCKKRLLRDLGDGNYQSPAVKHIEGPKIATKAPPPKALPAPAATKAAKPSQQTKPEEKRTRRGGKVAQYDVTNRELIGKKIKGRKRFTVKELQQFFRDEGRNDHSVSPVLTKMIQAGTIRMIAPGEYEPVTKKANGAEPTSGVVAAGEVTEVVNG